MKRIFIILFSAILFVSGCTKDNSGIEATGTIQDFTGLDGCGKMIVLDSGEKLEIISLPSNTTLEVNRRVKVEYKPVPWASVCMAGITAHIISLQYI
ncbi:MAG TPA: hypothetical protein VF144_19675 [Chitinophagaceae bacterium]